ncbi:MAG: hypothetical protein AAFP69_09375, partial [Planctomycetota bacterium]
FVIGSDCRKKIHIVGPGAGAKPVEINRVEHVAVAHLGIELGTKFRKLSQKTKCDLPAGQAKERPNHTASLRSNRSRAGLRSRSDCYLLGRPFSALIWGRISPAFLPKSKMS